MVISSDTISEHIDGMRKMDWLRLNCVGRVSREGKAALALCRR